MKAGWSGLASRRSAVAFALVLAIPAAVLRSSEAHAKPHGSPAPERRAPASGPRVDNAFGKLAVSFEANCGQCDGRAKYVARSGGASVLVAATETTLAREGRSLRLELVGADPASRVSGLDRLPGVANYLVGNDPSRWRTKIPTYAAVRCEGVWPGVDAIYRGRTEGLEFDFVVAP